MLQSGYYIPTSSHVAVAIGFSGPTKRLLNEVTCIVGILRGQLQDRVEVEVQLVVDYIVAGGLQILLISYSNWE